MSVDAGRLGRDRQAHIGQRHDQAHEVQQRRLPAAVDPREERHALDGHALAAQIGHDAVEVAREPGDGEFDVEFQGRVDQILGGSVLAGEVGDSRAVLHLWSRRGPHPTRRPLIAALYVHRSAFSWPLTSFGPDLPHGSLRSPFVHSWSLTLFATSPPPNA